MSKESAKSFVDKFYNDDEFIRELTLKGGVNSKASEEERSKLLMKVSKEMGFNFTEEEYSDAVKKYFEGKGVWTAIKTFRHFNKIAKKAEKEREKNKKHN
ncbi:MAG: Nif11-like leader peptide family natural product precursor [Bacilli bacterium]|nr:Nif11-like leader peptide family natural product precursor [Bacilli bacterium]